MYVENNTISLENVTILSKPNCVQFEFFPLQIERLKHYIIIFCMNIWGCIEHFTHNLLDLIMRRIATAGHTKHHRPKY